MDLQWIDSAIERTTAATDLLLALIAFAGFVMLRRFRPWSPWKSSVWASAFALLASSAFLGALAHALVWSPAAAERLWHFINLLLGATVALFGAGVVHDLWGPHVSRRSFLWLLVASGIFFAFTLRRPDDFFVFIVYEAVVMLLALAAYVFLAVSARLAGAGWMAAGILLSIAAAAIQAGGALTFTLIWPFDHNGLFHLVQAVGLVVLLRGLYLALHDETGLSLFG